jgi:hypothetical protein
MASLQVTCHIPDGLDKDQRIDAIGGSDWGQHPIDLAIMHIETGVNNYWTYVAGARANVIVAQRPNGRKYLKTTADGVEPNNLLALPHCR